MFRPCLDGKAFSDVNACCVESSCKIFQERNIRRTIFREILGIDSSKLKEFADDNFKFDEKW